MERQAISGKEAAALLATRWKVPGVAVVDLRELAGRGLLGARYGGACALLEVADVDAFHAAAELRAVVAARLAWWSVSVYGVEAALTLKVTECEFAEAVARIGIVPGMCRRYRRADVERIAAWLRTNGTCAGRAGGVGCITSTP